MQRSNPKVGQPPRIFAKLKSVDKAAKKNESGFTKAGHIGFQINFNFQIRSTLKKYGRQLGH